MAYLVRVKRMPLRRTKRMQKALHISSTLDTFSLIGLDPILVSLDATFISAFPLPLPLIRMFDSLATETLASPIS